MKTYEKMAEDALSRIEDYKTEQKKRRKTAVGIIVPVIALCVITVAGIGIHKNNIPKLPIADKTTYTEETYTTIAGVGNSKSKTEEFPVCSTQKNYEADTTMPTKIKDNEQSDSAANGFFQGVADNGSVPQETTKLVSDYPGGSAACYATPKKGDCFMSMPLHRALEEYGSGVLYRVTVELWNGDSQIVDKNVFSAEADRLFKLGYTSAIEEYNNGEQTKSLFTLHATAEQLESFAVNPDYGYFIYLYDEYDSRL